MKKFILLLAVLGFFAVSCTEYNKEKEEDVVIDLELEKKNVELVLEKYVIANETQEIGLVKEIWAPNEDIVIFGTDSDEKLIGWEQIKDALQKQFDTFEDTYISVRDQVVKVNNSGNVAWFSEVINYNYIYKGEAQSYEGIRFTGVLEKINGNWYIVQSHMSIPASVN